MCCFCILRLSPPTPGLSLGRRRMGAQLDGGFLSTPLDANFGPGPEQAAEWRLTRRGVCIHRFSLSPTASGMARRPWRSGIWTKSLQGGCGEKRHWISFYNSQVQKLLRLHRFSADGPRLPGLPLLAGPLAPLVRHLRAA